MVFPWLKEVNRAHKSVANYFLVIEMSSLLTVPIRTYVLMRLSYHTESNKDNMILTLSKKAERQLKCLGSVHYTVLPTVLPFIRRNYNDRYYFRVPYFASTPYLLNKAQVQGQADNFGPQK